MDLGDLESFRKKYPRVLGAVEALFRNFPAAERALRSLSFVKAQVEKETGSIADDLAKSLKPYKGELPTFASLPSAGRARKDILKDLEKMRTREEGRWKQGFVSGAVYHGDKSHIDFLNQVYGLYSQMNPLHSDLWPSGSKFESEIISMTATMLGAAHAGGTADENGICGSVSSGGTESILLAMKTYRDRARTEFGIRTPEMILPVSAHTAFEKAAQYFGIKIRRIPTGPDFRADVKACKKAINANTIVIVGSAPCFPHGVIDPIEEMSELARERGIGFHTDACLGGFVLPFAEKLGYPVPPFDFRLPGVTSMSADTHKFGYAAKGTSVVLYRGWKLRHHQYYTTTDWPGGMYFSPTFAGSRPGALVA
ncbi:MAG: aminotransferase class V-fold PLP-dependent enzyme, partial [Spirochaetia bacterium]|nr:aminotransferase class V-fold PLP-dependent enzyme [Spirochaetia bacterium]